MNIIIIIDFIRKNMESNVSKFLVISNDILSYNVNKT